ncbi:MAG: proton-conducting transporter membrane subunit [Chloroflexota bacterium]|nr:proton-conducting transporter membrane subunit [Chloroflexota bacterium]
MNLTWLIPLFPFLAFVAIALGAHRNKTASRRLAIGAVALSFVLAQIVFWQAVLFPVGGGDGLFESTAGWFSIGATVFEASVWVDPLTAVMLFGVPLVCLLVFVYSAGHMRDDPRCGRFFAYVSLLAAGMLGLVVSGNLLMLFLCWEVVGTCSCLLITFRFEEESAYRAGLKAFLFTKVGDVFLLLGLLVLYSAAGSLQYRDIFDAGTLDLLARAGFLGTQFPVVTVIALLIFGGVVSQAAQFPLHVWLPDAVKGPAPASALIQSATMVPSGLYLMARCFPLYMVAGGEAQMVLVAAGAGTALFAALIATAQDDARHVLAFSTISQLGYVVAALGAGAYVAGVFHLVTHAFSKALLALGVGSITQGMEHRPPSSSQGEGLGEGVPSYSQSEEPGDVIPCDPNDVKNMGGLARRQPVTYWTFVAGVLSLSGFPFLTIGFWSQQGIMGAAYEMHPSPIFWVLAATAGLTAFYAMRLLCLIFLGRARSDAAANVHKSERSMKTPLIILAIFAVCLGWGGVLPDWFRRFVGNGHTVETARFTWQPLVISVGFSLGGLLVGYLLYGWEPLWAGQMDRLEAGMRRVWLGWLHDLLRDRFRLGEFYQATFVRGAVGLAHVCAGFDRMLDRPIGCVARAGRIVSRVAARCDTLLIDRTVNLAGRAARATSGLCALLDPRLLDLLAEATGRAARAISDASGVFEIRIVDGAVEEVSSAVRAGGRLIRPIQTGRVQNYVLVASISVMVLVAIYFTMVYFAWW